MPNDRNARRGEEALDVAALTALVKKYDLRWAEDPSLNYPPAEMGACGRGWLPLVESLVAELIGLGWNRQLVQVKEKFGGLRFYVADTTPEMHALVEEAELESLTLCEVCGAPGRMSDRMPSKVRCSEHAAL